MKVDYRPEIDGLRAIAVISVIIYHAQFTFFSKKILPGGFIGVDIFFVISGYLITSIILKELVINNNFSFKNFYLRRARRILPPIFIVILFTFPLFIFLLFPSQLVELSKSVFFTLIFGSNFYFYFSGLVYGAESGLLKPFLHTWSLSVEEQFYIFFPLILIIIFKYIKKYLLHTFIIGFIFSLALAIWGSEYHPSLTFYALPTRGWEILAGSILAYLNLSQSKKKFSNYGGVFEFTGLVLIIYALIFFNDTIRHPSIKTLLPVLGVSLIIWFSKKDQIISNLLSSKIMVKVGLISYSLYLWHYPLFAYHRYLNFDLGNFKKLEIIIFSFILAILTYLFIEKPTRNKLVFSNKKIIILISLIFLLLINLSFFTSYNKNMIGYFYKFLPDRLSTVYSVFKDTERDLSTTIFTDNKCKFWIENENDVEKKINICRKKYKKAIFILGDSHAVNLYNILAQNKSVNFVVGYVQTGCRLTDYRSFSKCDNFDLFMKQSKKNLEKQDTIIYHQNLDIGNLSIANKYFEQETLKNNKIIWLGPFQEWGYLPRDVINDFKKDQTSINKYDKLNPSKKKQVQKVNKILKKYFEFSHILSIPFDALYEIPDKAIIKDRNSKNCLQFYNEDHFSVCGENIASQNLKREFLKKHIY
ncbi:acyltransferase [Candidatus Pelagibacter sp.]|nr:acyltransferase [Candidatus Pelagibacter sp.]